MKFLRYIQCVENVFHLTRTHNGNNINWREGFDGEKNDKDT